MLHGAGVQLAALVKLLLQQAVTAALPKQALPDQAGPQGFAQPEWAPAFAGPGLQSQLQPACTGPAGTIDLPDQACTCPSTSMDSCV